MYDKNSRSIGGVTTGNAWLRNNPDIKYPEGHETMSDKELEAALRVDESVWMVGVKNTHTQHVDWSVDYYGRIAEWGKEEAERELQLYNEQPRMFTEAVMKEYDSNGK